MSVEINENHKIVTVEHELHYEGHFLCERKQMIIEHSDNDGELALINNFCCDGPENSNNERRITLVHLRQIDEKCYKVTEDFLKGHECQTEEEYSSRKVNTEMTDEEVKKFEEDWKNFWDPEITKKMIENLQERMLGEINENHKIVTVEHELHYEGHFLSERKQMITNFCCDGPENSNNERRITLVHLRQIDEKCYKVTEDFLHGHECETEEEYSFRKVDTEMTDEEVKQFEEDWKNFWDPEITKKMFENLQERIK